MSTIFTLGLIIAACLYIGILLGKKRAEETLELRVEIEREKIRQQVKEQQTTLAVELHGELAKVRDSIVQSAHAYQHVVNAIDAKLAPWEDVQKALQIENPRDLPLLINSEENGAEGNGAKENSSQVRKQGEPAVASPQAKEVEQTEKAPESLSAEKQGDMASAATDPKEPAAGTEVPADEADTLEQEAPVINANNTQESTGEKHSLTTQEPQGLETTVEQATADTATRSSDETSASGTRQQVNGASLHS